MARSFTVSDRQAAQETRRVSKSPQEILRTADLDLLPSQEPLVEARLAEMPASCRNTYIKAMRGRSMATSIRAFCQMCYAWDEFRGNEGIRSCPDPACPLWPHRPYQGRKACDTSR